MTIPEDAPIRYVALGDSFSEGVGDEGPAALLGWTGRLASALAATSGRPVSFANLAIRGRLLDGVLGEQVDQALALDPEPTLATFCAGGNDLLRPSFDIPTLIGRLGAAADRFRDRGIRLALVSPADPSARLPLGRLINRRGDAWATALAELATDRGLPFVDVSRDTQLGQAEFWSTDRLHMNALGHRRVAALALRAIADGPGPDEAAAPGAARTRLADELRYYREYVVPWLGRRITRRSSGDGRTAPYPTWTPVS
ncbi:SGNH/GDSL hydrolase family protein [Curtobacterium sp. ISL-83]|uniref:SGNH/GDSL hydrolase family protein n=1 Tax=Curtobacterium sp. ISL-83 TaxID=2819145 RepID=UPI001BE8FD4F|nr:SGNH/GDSL hydrolase family protein [Curtobacterium sp. ISL-83]MBT2503611.1 SGNH/GDSL hydrolase family protein [Curtobacterium sp. ISL-83]